MNHTTPVVDRLAEAARQLRHVVANATPAANPYPGGWSGFGTIDVDGYNNWAEVYGGPAVDGYRTGHILKTDEHCDACTGPTNEDVAYICTVHPGVGLAVAELLESAAEVTAEINPDWQQPSTWAIKMLAVADQILGIPTAKALAEHKATHAAVVAA